MRRTVFFVMARKVVNIDEIARLGFLMREWRHERDLTQAGAAELAGISAATWGAIERTPRHAPDAHTLRAIARTIGSSPVAALRAGGFDPELGDVVEMMVGDLDAAIASCIAACEFLRARRAELVHLVDRGSGHDAG
jgi:DNA-binding XRE family transcriptional regulator